MQQQTKAFDKLTDRVEDRQLDSSRVQEVLFTLSLLSFLVIAFEIENTFRSAFISFSKSRPKTEIKQPNAMASIAASAEADWQAMRLREKELAAVKINAADVDIIANELELDKKVAERTLREHKGDAVAAIRHLLR
ncbi:hypothetical protein ACSQ67_006280 [Phaseolus vulgaris]